MPSFYSHFFDIQEKFSARTALVCNNGSSLTYSQMWSLQDALLEDVAPGSLLFILCRNTVVPIAGYLGCLRKRIVPLLLPESVTGERLQALVSLYRPGYILTPSTRAEELSCSLSIRKVTHIYSDKDNPQSCMVGESPHQISDGESWQILTTGESGPYLHPDLALLLSTSGSTGSGKLVRLSRRNLQSNAESIASSLSITEDDRPITSLPMEYTYGLSVINSHVLCGATLLVTNAGPLEETFWQFLQKERATSLAGVPYSYALWERLHIFDMELPSLRSLTQAGGRLPADLQMRFGTWAVSRKIRFTIMYGQTEATARMSYLPPERCLEKPGSIGIPIPGGSFSLTDEGELLYGGPNVSLGYAECASDLARGDDNRGVLHTGDLARRDSDGYYYITGRKSRFVKITGHRIGLDDLEDMLNNFDPGSAHLCTGDDTGIRVHVVCDRLPQEAEKEKERTDSIRTFLCSQIGIRPSLIRVFFRTAIPRTESGKIQYAGL